MVLVLITEDLASVVTAKVLVGCQTTADRGMSSGRYYYWPHSRVQDQC